MRLGCIADHEFRSRRVPLDGNHINFIVAGTVRREKQLFTVCAQPWVTLVIRAVQIVEAYRFAETLRGGAAGGEVQVSGPERRARYVEHRGPVIGQESVDRTDRTCGQFLDQLRRPERLRLRGARGEEDRVVAALVAVRSERHD